jgi:flagellar capping protein FliD
MLQQIPRVLAKTIVTIRKRIETTISQLTETFSINKTKARSFHGLIARINRKILSYTTALFFNYQLVKEQFTQLEHLIQA